MGGKVCVYVCGGVVYVCGGVVYGRGVTLVIIPALLPGPQSQFHGVPLGLFVYVHSLCTLCLQLPHLRVNRPPPCTELRNKCEIAVVECHQHYQTQMGAHLRGRGYRGTGEVFRSEIPSCSCMSPLPSHGGRCF